MAIHDSLNKLTAESLRELLHVVDYSMAFRKSDDWKTHNGILGVPALILMFTIVDSIGSYHRGKQIKYRVVGAPKSKSINKTGDHFLILNGELFGQALAADELKALYEVYRSKLIHNLALPSGYFIEIGDDTKPFLEKSKMDGKHSYHLRLVPFAAIVKNGLEKFILKLDEIMDESVVKRNEISVKDIYKVSKLGHPSENILSNPGNATIPMDSTGTTSSYTVINVK